MPPEDVEEGTPVAAASTTSSSSSSSQLHHLQKQNQALEKEAQALRTLLAQHEQAAAAAATAFQHPTPTHQEEEEEEGVGQQEQQQQQGGVYLLLLRKWREEVLRLLRARALDAWRMEEKEKEVAACKAKIKRLQEQLCAVMQGKEEASNAVIEQLEARCMALSQERDEVVQSITTFHAAFFEQQRQGGESEWVAAAAKLERCEARLGFMQERVETLSVLQEQKEVQVRNTLAALEADRRGLAFLVHERERNQEEVEEVEQVVLDLPLLPLRPEAEAAMRRVFREVDRREGEGRGWVDTQLLVQALVEDEGVNGLMAEWMGEEEWVRVKGEMGDGLPRRHETVTWGEFLLYFVPDMSSCPPLHPPPPPLPLALTEHGEKEEVEEQEGEAAEYIKKSEEEEEVEEEETASPHVVILPTPSSSSSLSCLSRSELQREVEQAKRERDGLRALLNKQNLEVQEKMEQCHYFYQGQIKGQGALVERLEGEVLNWREEVERVKEEGGMRMLEEEVEARRRKEEEEEEARRRRKKEEEWRFLARLEELEALSEKLLLSGGEEEEEEVCG